MVLSESRPEKNAIDSNMRKLIANSSKIFNSANAPRDVNITPKSKALMIRLLECQSLASHTTIFMCKNVCIPVWVYKNPSLSHDSSNMLFIYTPFQWTLHIIILIQISI